MIYEVHPPNQMSTKPKKRRPSPILDIFPVLDIGASDIDLIMQAARAFPNLAAYDSPDGQWIAIATEQPTKTQIRNFLKTAFSL
jgi:hypothetical protein